MKKWAILLGLWMFNASAFAATLPDNMYFNAMKDEMARSVKKLRRQGVPAPLFIVYKLENLRAAEVTEASFGELYPAYHRDDKLNAYVMVSIGTKKQDSLGYKHDSYSPRYAYAPESYYNIAKSYDGIRQALWEMTDSGYLFAAELYEQKEAYKRTKQEEKQTKLPDFMPTKQAHYVEEIKSPERYPMEQVQAWVKQLSAQGKVYPFLEQFSVRIEPSQRDTYYLNNLGGFYQVSQSAVLVRFVANMRNTSGYKQNFKKDFWLSSLQDDTYEKLAKNVSDFLHELEQLQKAVKPEPYLGPVLLRPLAAGQFIYNLLVENLQNAHPLLSSNNEVDVTAGKMRNPGQRVMSPGIAVYDRPQMRFVPSPMGMIPLGGFMPVDDEGVAATDLTLVDAGRLQQLPRTTRPFGDQTPSNGHARLTERSFPREQLTNVYVQPQVALSDKELEEKLLDRCRELGLDYGYILYALPDNEGTIARAVRVYTTGNKRERVYGLRLTNLTTRALRDITAAGDQPEVVWIYTEEASGGVPGQSISSPALLVDEMEFVPTDKKPDKKPFVPKPQ